MVPSAGASGRIVYESDDGSTGSRLDLFSADSNGHHVRQLTHTHRNESEASFSSNGHLIVFVASSSHRDLYVMRANGSHVRRLTHDGKYERDPAFSPNGQSVVFTKGAFHTKLCLIKVRTGRERCPDDAPRDVLEPSFAPNGHHIAFYKAGAIYLSQPDGAHASRVLPSGWGLSFQPQFSPDGRSLVFMGRRGGGSDEIYTTRVNGTHVRRLTNDASFLDASPTFSPDGGHIAFISDRPGGSLHFDVFTMTSRGAGVRNLTHTHSRRRRHRSLLGPGLTVAHATSPPT